MKDFQIRQCTLNDIEAIQQMQADWAEARITYGQVPDSKDELLSRLGQYFLVADIDDSAIGFTCGSVRVSEGLAIIPAGEQYFEIDEIYVKPEFGSEGIGGMLIEKLMSVARSNGIQRFSVYSATKDLDRIMAFYRRHSFKSWYVRMFI